jgi:ribA/ribD-fused uncharacterized protein
MEEFLFFWGGPFSNFYPAKFSIDGISYFCTEQFFMSKKALFFNDYEINEKIMNINDDPKAVKRLGRQVNNFKADEWNKVSRIYMRQGNIAKYTQNEDLRKKLIDTGNKTLVEANPYDKIWSIGLSESDPRALDKSKWLGLNWLGKTLMKVRNYLNNNYLFVPYDIAFDMHLLDFSECCFAYYNENKEIIQGSNDYALSAPMYSQFVVWLENKYNKHFSQIYYNDGITPSRWVYNLDGYYLGSDKDKAIIYVIDKIKNGK